jgi:ABC-type phosphate/phosphonate transport system substrate-binding protein
MYDLVEVRPAVEALWAKVAGRLRDAGVPLVPTTLHWDGDLYDAHWLHPQLLLSQSCGWPVVDRLAGRVAIVGAFTYRGVSDADARYRSVLVTRAGDTSSLDHPRVAVNSFDSLSGWISLLAAIPRHRISAVVLTGAHVHSAAAVFDGRADLACIDGVTWTLLGRFRPDAVAGLVPIGHGPLIPCLPLVTHPTMGPGVSTLRAALAELSSDVLAIDGFVPVDESHYAPVLALGANYRTSMTERATARS